MAACQTRAGIGDREPRDFTPSRSAAPWRVTAPSFQTVGVGNCRRAEETGAMGRAASHSVGRGYDLARVCRPTYLVQLLTRLRVVCRLCRAGVSSEVA